MKSGGLFNLLLQSIAASRRYGLIYVRVCKAVSDLIGTWGYTKDMNICSRIYLIYHFFSAINALYA